MDTRNNVNKPSDYFIPSQSNAVKEHNNSMGKDQFLQLLIAQLQNQDPISPQENTEFIAQMAQFSALEAMNNMAAAFSQNQAFSMIGRGAVGVTVDSNGVAAQVIGIVDSAGVEGGEPYVMIGEKKISAGNIQQVFDPSAVQGNTQTLLTSAAMVGKYVSGEYSLDGVAMPISGRVESMVMDDGKYYLLVDGKRVPLNTINMVSDTMDGLEAAANS
ncbi:MAG: hypothetical protein FWH06_03080 [Oscillospiraceae bacterium]|nr:hypothetical protein [Oscillospiraceae bacterium]